MPFSREGVELTDGFRQQLITQRDQAGVFVGREWRRTVDFDDFEASHSRFLDRAERIVATSQVGAAFLANQYFSNFVGAELGAAALAGFDQATQAIAGEIAAAKLEQQVDRLIAKIRGRTRDGRAVRDVLAPSGPAALNVLGQGRGRAEADMVGRARAVRVAATETVDAGNEMLHQVMAFAPDEAVSGWWRMTGNDPCRACLGYATRGKVHTRSRIQIHPNCRCTMVPALGDLPDVEPLETGLQKWASMSEAEQDELMGAEVAQMLREGRISFADLVERSRNPDWDDTISERSKAALAELAGDEGDFDIDALLQKRMDDLFAETQAAAAVEEAVDVDALLAEKMAAMFEDAGPVASAVPEHRRKLDELLDEIGSLDNVGLDANGQWDEALARAHAARIEEIGTAARARIDELARSNPDLIAGSFDRDVLGRLQHYNLAEQAASSLDAKDALARQLEDALGVASARRFRGGGLVDRVEEARTSLMETVLSEAGAPMSAPVQTVVSDAMMRSAIDVVDSSPATMRVIQDAVSAAGTRYPASAMDRVGPVPVGPLVRRGYFDGRGVALSSTGPPSVASMTQVATHEMGHVLESNIVGLARAQHGWLAARADMGRWGVMDGNEKFWPRADGNPWHHDYVARISNQQMGGQLAATREAPSGGPRPVTYHPHYETFTMGTEMVYGMRPSYQQSIGTAKEVAAVEHADFTLGLLAMLGRLP